MPPGDIPTAQLLYDNDSPPGRQYLYDYDDDNIVIGTGHRVEKQTVKRIVMHHTVSECNIEGINNAHKKGTRGFNTSSLGYDIRYHKLLLKDWWIFEARPEDEVGRWTKEHNADTYHIALCGNFDVEHPTESQMDNVRMLINWLREVYGDVPVYEHWDLEATGCAWDNFRLEDIFKNQIHEIISINNWDIELGKNTKVIEPDLTGCPEKEGFRCLFYSDQITAYYSPVAWQSRYFAWTSYNASVAMNGNNINASGRPYSEDHRYTHWACGFSMKGRDIWIDGWSDQHGMFHCADRGGAIDWNDIDIRFGIWEQALDRLDGKGSVPRTPRPHKAWVYEKI